MRISRCTSCGASILWAETVNGKAMPLDEMPDPDGKFALDEADEPPIATYKHTNPGGAERFTSHFATCPDAAKFRR